MRERPWLARADMVLLVITLFLVSMIAGAVLRRSRHHPVPAHLMAAFLDVGSGDSTVLRAPGGQAVLIDTGPAASGPIVAATLRRQGIHTLALLVLASPAPGSIGGLRYLLDSGIAVQRVWVCPGLKKDMALQGDMKRLQTKNIAVDEAVQGSEFDWEGLRLKALWPPRGPLSQTQTVICRLRDHSMVLLLAAPASGAEMAQLVSSEGDKLRCNVLETADHGADGASSLELLRRAAPSVAVISCSTQYPPGQKTLQNLEAAGAGVWRTDIQGAVSIFTRGRAAPVVTAAHL